MNEHECEYEWPSNNNNNNNNNNNKSSNSNNSINKNNNEILTYSEISSDEDVKLSSEYVEW